MKKKENIYTILAKRIREERKRLGLTQEEVAEKAGMDYKFLSGIERNVDKPSLDTFVRIAEALGVSYNSLLTDKNQETDSSSKYLVQAKYFLSKFSKKKRSHIISVLKEIEKIAEK